MEQYIFSWVVDDQSWLGTKLHQIPQIQPDIIFCQQDLIYQAWWD